MKALRYLGSKAVELAEIPVPDIQDGEVLVAMRACGICGTDIKTYLRGHPKLPPGIVLGHEAAGVVVASRSVNFQEGDRVVAAPYAPCGGCVPCRRGLFSLCEDPNRSYLDPGGFSELIRVPAGIVSQSLLKLPASLSFEQAALTEPLACCVHGLEVLNLHAGGSLLIMGDGPMGLTQAALGKALGASPILLSGMIPERLDFARRIVDYVVDVTQDDLFTVVRKVLPAGVDNIFVSAGDLNLAQQAMELVAKGGAINLFAGLPRASTLTLDTYRIHYEEVRLSGTFGFGPEQFCKAFDWLATGQLNLQGLITRAVPLSKAREALDEASRYIGIKTIVTAAAFLPGSQSFKKQNTEGSGG